jgi:hypothetical protein
VNNILQLNGEHYSLGRRSTKRELCYTVAVQVVAVQVGAICGTTKVIGQGVTRRSRHELGCSLTDRYNVYVVPLLKQVK